MFISIFLFLSDCFFYFFIFTDSVIDFFQDFFFNAGYVSLSGDYFTSVFHETGSSDDYVIIFISSEFSDLDVRRFSSVSVFFIYFSNYYCFFIFDFFYEFRNYREVCSDSV